MYHPHSAERSVRDEEEPPEVYGADTGFLSPPLPPVEDNKRLLYMVLAARLNQLDASPQTTDKRLTYTPGPIA